MTKESKAAQKRREKAEAVAYLRGILPPGSHVYATVRTVSRSGMSRRIDLYGILPGKVGYRDGRPWLARLSYYAGVALGWPSGDEGIRVEGCGMDMRFHLVDALSGALYGYERDAGGEYVHARLRVEAF